MAMFPFSLSLSLSLSLLFSMESLQTNTPTRKNKCDSFSSAVVSQAKNSKRYPTVPDIGVLVLVTFCGGCGGGCGGGSISDISVGLEVTISAPPSVLIYKIRRGKDSSNTHK